MKCAGTTLNVEHSGFSLAGYSAEGRDEVREPMSASRRCDALSRSLLHAAMSICAPVQVGSCSSVAVAAASEADLRGMACCERASSGEELEASSVGGRWAWPGRPRSCELRGATKSKLVSTPARQPGTQGVYLDC